MEAERWRQIDELLEAAFELNADKRAAFLREACAGDGALLREVEELLSAHAQAEDFIETPALQVAAQSLAQSAAESMLGTRVERYEIRSLLGAGGSGDVYLAEDLKLHRPVALKLLSGEFGGDPLRRERFEHEAFAASSLNHPGILTIYEANHTDDVYFIATEYVDGVTLREWSAHRAATLSDVLDIGIQIAIALSAAHEAGIVHRDIKPENVMIRRDGYVKVLDFGIAKLVESASPLWSDSSESRNGRSPHTAPGLILGTVNYMSPEQARSLPVDARTDVWSLGVVLFEMVTGTVPFDGATAMDTLAAILDRPPPPLVTSAYIVPDELHSIIGKSLSKNADERYQTAKELADDLRALKRRIETLVPVSRRNVNNSGLNESVHNQNSRTKILKVGDDRGSRQRRARPLAFAAIAACLLVAIVLVALVAFRSSSSRQSAAPTFESMKFDRLTTSGQVLDAVVTPDGKYVAYVENDGHNHSIFLKQLATNGVMQILPPTPQRIVRLAFSPDGDYLYYLEITGTNILYQIPIIGGTPRKVMQQDFVEPPSFAPDGRRFVSVMFNFELRQLMLDIVNLDGTIERTLAKARFPEALLAPDWSPDGKRIAYAKCSEDDAGNYCDILAVEVESGTVQTLSSRRWYGIDRRSGIKWLKSGDALIFTGLDMPSSAVQVWELAYPSGQFHRITNDANNYSGISVTSDSNALVSVQGKTESNIWVAPSVTSTNARGAAGAPFSTNRARQITFGKREGYWGLAWTPGGQIIYAASGNAEESIKSLRGNRDLWIINSDGMGRRQLTTDGKSDQPAVSPDGRYVVFVSFREKAPQLWRMESDGSNPVQLTHGKGALFPAFADDGRWIVFHSIDNALLSDGTVGTLAKVSIDGGEEVPLTDRYSFRPAVSPDGKYIAWLNRKDTIIGRKLSVMSIHGGEPLKTLDAPNLSLTFIGWTPDAGAVAALDSRNGVFNIWRLPLDGTTSTQMTDFISDRIFSFAWSRDGKQLALARGADTRDVILIRHFN